MKWNKGNGKWQQSKRGTARAHEYYFVTQHGTGSHKWLIGYRGFGELIVMHSQGLFETASDARKACEQIDANAVVIEAVNA